MEIINPEIIEQEEQRLLLSIADSLDLNATREMFEKESGFKPIEKIKIQSSDIVVFGSQIVFKFKFEALAMFSLLIDRFGNYLEMNNHNPIRMKNRQSDSPANTLRIRKLSKRAKKKLLKKSQQLCKRKRLKNCLDRNLTLI